MHLSMLIFLDFDGVLHPIQASPGQRWTGMYVLADVLYRRPHIKVVVSSSHREFTTMEEIQSIFPADLRDRVIGATPMVAVGAGDVRLPGRRREILAWLNGNGLSESTWIAIDDDAERFASGCRQLYLVDSSNGLTWADVNDLCGLIDVA